MFRIVVFLTTLVLPGFALAQSAFYGELRGGAAFLTDADLDSGFDDELSFDTGFLVEAAAGYAHESGVRGELALGYRENDHDELDLELIGTFDASGDTSAFTAMANVYYDFDFGSPKLRPYIGFGLGLAVIDVDLSAAGVKLVDDDDTVFAYQALAGIAYHFTPNVAATLGYAYLATGDPGFDVQGGGSVDAEYASHNVLAGIRYSF